MAVCRDEIVGGNAGFVVLGDAQGGLEDVGANDGQFDVVANGRVGVGIGACVVDLLQGVGEFSSDAGPLECFEVVVLEEDD